MGECKDIPSRGQFDKKIVIHSRLVGFVRQIAWTNGLVGMLFLAPAPVGWLILTRCSSSKGVIKGFTTVELPRACVVGNRRVTGVKDVWPCTSSWWLLLSLDASEAAEEE